MKIIIAGNYGAKNLGDEMILEGMIKTLKSLDSKMEITVLSANPKETEEKHKVKSVHKFPAGFRSLIKYILKSSKQKNKKALKECDYFILGGGGLFSNLTLRAYFIWGIQGFMALIHKKPIIMYGQSVGPVKSWIGKIIIKKLFNKSIFIAIRDANSKEELIKLGIKKEIHLIPDMIFALNSYKAEKKKKIIVALRQIKNLENCFKNEIINFINWLIEEKNYDIEIVNFQTPDDKILSEEIINRIRIKKKISQSPQIQFSKDLFQKFAEAEYIIGMRLHSILSAIKTDVPFIGINYAPKVENFLKCAKLGDLLVEMKNSGLKKRFKKLEKSKYKTIERLKAFNRHAENRHKIVGQELKKILYKE
jgi:polysaccharide pyruvyl transferase CsaB